MIRCAVDSPYLGRLFKYPEHYLSMYRKFFRDTWSQKSRQNMAFWSLYKRFKSCIFLKKLLTFRFWSIKPPQNVTQPFRSHGKIGLSLKNILDTYKAFQMCTENFFWAIFKKLFFSKILLFVRVWAIFPFKKDFRTKKLFENGSEKVFCAPLKFFVGI